MHLRSNDIVSHPKAAIFSFRDNEYSSHAEVKYIVETQLSVRVKSIQFDPLDVRTQTKGARSRWIVEFNTESDLEVAIKKGLILGKDKLMFYRYDTANKKDVSTLKFFVAAVNAKRKLRRAAQTLKKRRQVSSMSQD
ncbi:hypothetical protein DPMN_146344 [Dreissena polymorpha]|uniref:Uncharacterized protein n=1 Tax=Dreissena polymorpha TaxID=45954 RepID=A0A9D4IZM2_DREPO|nr:hypothetical protein DPMN_146344 [Dreissena polymorpha]